MKLKIKKASTGKNKVSKKELTTVIKTEDLNFYYFPGQKTLKKINLKIQKNKVTSFIGPSGCGKSTLLRCFNRMNDYIEDFSIKGEILIDNKKIYWKNVIVEKLRKEMTIREKQIEKKKIELEKHIMQHAKEVIEKRKKEIALKEKELAEKLSKVKRIKTELGEI